MNLLLSCMVTGMVFFAAPTMAQDAGPPAGNTTLEILIQKIKADKKLVVAGNMNLTDAEAKSFWPLYDAYQKELDIVNQRLGKAIKDYADAYNAGKGEISNALARTLLNDALSVDEAEVKLKRTYAEKIDKVLPATKTARYIQIESKVRAILRAELAQNIPLVY